jgi:phosphoglycerol transferase MdoB-like AlkP superfamily enzyme
MRKISAYISILIALLFNFLWIMQLIPLLMQNQKIEFLYSIYILDLCFVMPAFIIVAILALRKKPLGVVLAPFMFIMGFFVIFPLGLGEIAKPYYQQAANSSSMIMSFGLSAMFILLAGLHLKSLNIDK